MSTRHLVMVVLDGQYKIAQYCHSSGQPIYAGENITEWIRNQMQLDKFKTALRNCQFASDEWLAKMYAEAEKAYGKDENFDWPDNYDGEESINDSVILDLVQDGHYTILTDHTRFAGDVVFCEWVYVVNLDTLKLEVFECCNEEPLQSEERFHFLTKPPKNDGRPGDGRHPAKLLAVVPFCDLRDNTMKMVYDLRRNKIED